MPKHASPDLDLISSDTAGTLPGLLLQRAERSPDSVAYSEFSEGAWRDVTWLDMVGLVSCWRVAFDGAGLEPGDRVAVMLPNCIDWVAFDLAAMANGLITVPLYPHDSVANIEFILDNTGARLCLIGGGAAWKSIQPALVRSDALDQVWLRDGDPDQDYAGGFRIRSLAEALDGPGTDPGPPRCAPQDIATLIHTSGTTGWPKGAILTHRALLWDAEAVTKVIPPMTTDVFLSLLPLAHAFERTMTYHMAMMGGARVVFARSIQTLRQDLQDVQPTILIAVPRLYERLHDVILRKAARSRTKKWLADRAAALGWRMFEARHGRGRRPGPLTRWLVWPVLSRLVARPVLQAFGGRMRVAAAGGAPLSDRVSHFLIGLGVPLVEGYGLTEAAPVVSAVSLEDNRPGSVGRPLPGSEIMLGPQDELFFRAPSLMQGYWQDPEKSADAIDTEGWLHTGDIAEIREGRIFITGRIKDLIVLSTGKNVASAQVEAVMSADPLFDQCSVLGDNRPFLIAVIVLNEEEWKAAAEAKGIDAGDPNAPEASGLILSRIAAAMQDQPAYARVRAVHAVLDPWTVEDGSLTPTLKIKRRVIETRYRAEIDALYEQRVGSRHGGQ